MRHEIRHVLPKYCDDIPNIGARPGGVPERWSAGKIWPERWSAELVKIGRSAGALVKNRLER